MSFKDNDPGLLEDLAMLRNGGHLPMTVHRVSRTEGGMKQADWYDVLHALMDELEKMRKKIKELEEKIKKLKGGETD